MLCKNTLVHSFCFLPLQQKMAQKIMKLIQGDFIEKPDFALKSIGKWSPPAMCVPHVSSDTLRRVGLSAGLVHPLLLGSTSSELTLLPCWMSLMEADVGRRGPAPSSSHSPSSNPGVRRAAHAPGGED